MNASASRQLRTVVLVSGRGSNLQAIIAAADAGLPVELVMVISNRGDASALQKAADAGIPARVVERGNFASRDAFDDALQQAVDDVAPDLVLLAGFMHLLAPEIVTRYQGRMLNIHPSLLPRFRGLNTHQRVLDAGEKRHGASVHFVTDELDGGPVIAQAGVPVLPADNVELLATRVLTQEHRLFPLVVGWYVQGRIRLQGHHAVLDGLPLDTPALLDEKEDMLHIQNREHPAQSM